MPTRAAVRVVVDAETVTSLVVVSTVPPSRSGGESTYAPAEACIM
jgi:hypothetical protein